MPGHDSNALAAEPCDANLVGWWKFDEGAGNTVADSSANSNTGVSTSATPTWVGGYPNDPCDSAMYFPGDDVPYDYVLCAERDGNGPGTYPAELMPDEFTISCWTKLDSFAYYGGFVGNGIDGESGFYMHSAEHGAGNFGAALYTESGGWVDVSPTNTYVIDTWYHLAFSYDGTSAKFYVDGAEVEDVEAGGPIRWTDSSGDYPDNFTIGSYESLTDYYPADGTIDEVRYYDYALQSGEVAVLAGLQGSIYFPLEVKANLVSRVPDPAVDPNYYPDNPDIVNFEDFDVVADNWLDEILWPLP